MAQTKKFLNNNRYGIFFFVGLIIRMLINMPFGTEELADPFTYLFYIVNYRTAGFVPRALLGSVVSVFFRFITIRIFYAVALVMTLALITAASVLVNRAFRNISEGRTALFLILCTFLFLSNGNYYIFDAYHFGIYDIYFILFTLATVCFAKNKILRWLVPVNCLICMAIYEGYIFAFMAAVGIVLLHNCFKEKTVSSWAVLILTCILCVSAFVYFYVLFRTDYWNMLNYGSYGELTEALRQHTNMEISDLGSEVYYYDSSMTLFTDGRWNVKEVIESTRPVRQECLPTALIFCALTLSVWMHALKNEKDKRFKAVWLLCSLAPLTSLPFLVFSEQMKYISYFVFTQMILIMYFSKEKNVQLSLMTAERIINEKPFLICIPWGLMLLFRSIW